MEKKIQNLGVIYSEFDMIPKEFDGKFLIYPNGDQTPVTVTFYRRETETENHMLKDFVDSIKVETIGWDCLTRQLFYKSKDGKTYNLNFKEYKQKNSSQVQN
jgi:hypothetical protein